VHCTVTNTPPPPSVLLFIISDLHLPQSPGIFHKNILPFKFYHHTHAMARNHQHRRSNRKHHHGRPSSGASTMPPTTVSQERTSTTTDNVSSHLQCRSFNEGVVSPPATMVPEHGHDTRHAAFLCIADASHSHGSQVPVTMVDAIPGPLALRYPVPIASIDADVPAPASSFCGTPIEMFPGGFSIESHSGGSVASTSPAMVMQTMITGIQDMFHCQTIAAHKDSLARIASEDEAQAIHHQGPDCDFSSVTRTRPLA
jgi:hypothetical protein